IILEEGKIKNYGAFLGAYLAYNEKRGKYFATFILPSELEDAYTWLGQIIVESLAKKDKDGQRRGIFTSLLKDKELIKPSYYDKDKNFFVYIHLKDDITYQTEVEKLKEEGFSVLEISLDSKEDFGEVVAAFNVGIALAGYLIEVNFADEPGVWVSKDLVLKVFIPLLGKKIEEGRTKEEFFEFVKGLVREEGLESDNLILDYGYLFKDERFEEEFSRILEKIARVENKEIEGVRTDIASVLAAIMLVSSVYKECINLLIYQNIDNYRKITDKFHKVVREKLRMNSGVYSEPEAQHWLHQGLQDSRDVNLCIFVGVSSYKDKDLPTPSYPLSFGELTFLQRVANYLILSGGLFKGYRALKDEPLAFEFFEKVKEQGLLKEIPQWGINLEIKEFTQEGLEKFNRATEKALSIIEKIKSEEEDQNNLIKRFNDGGKLSSLSIEFGTSGVRWSDKTNEEAISIIRRATQGIAEYCHKFIGEGKILVGFDTRLNNLEFAKEVASILAGNGIEVIIIGEPTPTPVLAYLANSSSQIKGVINLTASHNPYQDNGLKFSPYHGGAADKETTDLLSAYANKITHYKWMDFKEAKEKGLIKEMSLKEAIDIYVYGYIIPTLKKIGAWQAITDYLRKNPQIKIILDPMQGTSVKYLKTIFSELEKEVGRKFYRMIHTNNRDSKFSQVAGAPNPTEKESIKEALKLADKNTLILLTDGDADRFGVIDFEGREVPANQMLAILAFFLYSQGFKGAIGKTVATSNFVNAVADYLGLKLIETPVGFKWFVEKAVKEKINFLVAGEESAHIGILPFINSWDDGIAICLASLWIVSSRRKSLTQYREEIEKKLGKQFFYKRENIKLTEELKSKVKDLIDKTREEEDFAIRVLKEKNVPYDVSGVITVDGLKIVFKTGDWLCIRLSGTEPVARLYIELTNKERFDSIRNIGRKLLGGRLDGGSRKSLLFSPSDTQLSSRDGGFSLLSFPEGFQVYQETIKSKLNQLLQLIKGYKITAPPEEFNLVITTDLTSTQG
ncbi:MAG: hypothetical protein DRP72_03710, partial [Candidatus Omnitrophota bacterium]